MYDVRLSYHNKRLLTYLLYITPALRQLHCTALVTCSATYSIWAGESHLSCTVGLGAGLPCWRLSAGCWFRTEIPCGLRSDASAKRPIFCCRRSAYIEWADVQSTWHWAIADYFQWTSEDLLILHRVLRPRHGTFVTFMISLRRIQMYLLTYLYLQHLLIFSCNSKFMNVWPVKVGTLGMRAFKRLNDNYRLNFKRLTN